MQLIEHRNERRLFVRRADSGRIVVIDREFRSSLILDAERVAENFAPQSVHELDQAAIARILEFEPEVVLLGTGEKAVFPPPAIAAEFLKRGIGLESMDNAAAARTFNVLVGEYRRAVAVFLLADKSSSSRGTPTDQS